jgi:hypothetical protein
VGWLCLLCLGAVAADDGGARPQDLDLQLPTQFSAEVEIVAHLVNRSSSYPPWLTRMRLHYDQLRGLARADIQEGHQAGKLFLRRYDKVGSPRQFPRPALKSDISGQKWEYMVKAGIYPECRRSYLGWWSRQRLFGPPMRQRRDSPG